MHQMMYLMKRKNQPQRSSLSHQLLKVHFADSFKKFVTGTLTDLTDRNNPSLKHSKLTFVSNQPRKGNCGQKNVSKMHLFRILPFLQAANFHQKASTQKFSVDETPP